MASKEILSQDEIDALLKGVKSGEVPTGTAPAEGDGAEDFASLLDLEREVAFARRLTRETSFLR